MDFKSVVFSKTIGITACMLLATTLSVAAVEVSSPAQTLPKWSLGQSYVGYLSDNFETETPVSQLGTNTVSTMNITNAGNEGSQSTTTIITLGNDPSVSLSGTAAATKLQYNNTVAEVFGTITLTYGFIVLNAPSGALVPLTVNANYTTSSAYQTAYLGINARGTQIGDIQESSGTTPWQPITENFLAGTIYTVTITVEGEASAANGSASSFTAAVDPTIAIASSFNNVNGYSLEFSADVGAVPEPSTWAMMILGFLGLALAYRGKDRLAKTAA